MRGNSSAGNLAPLDLEIEATCRRNNKERRRKFLQERTAQPSLEKSQSSESFLTFPDLRESKVGASEAHIMAEDQSRRVSLEDYSSSTVLQFFTSIAQPEAQAHNITYPHSLIQLIQGNLFHGLPNEDCYTHLATYIEICNTVKITGVPEDAVRLSLFSFSLAGEAKMRQANDVKEALTGRQPNSFSVFSVSLFFVHHCI